VTTEIILTEFLGHDKYLFEIFFISFGTGLFASWMNKFGLNPASYDWYVITGMN